VRKRRPPACMPESSVERINGLLRQLDIAECFMQGRVHGIAHQRDMGEHAADKCHRRRRAGAVALRRVGLKPLHLTDHRCNQPGNILPCTPQNGLRE
jgi:hypothetical protein